MNTFVSQSDKVVRRFAFKFALFPPWETGAYLLPPPPGFVLADTIFATSSPSFPRRRGHPPTLLNFVWLLFSPNLLT